MVLCLVSKLRKESCFQSTTNKANAIFLEIALSNLKFVLKFLNFKVLNYILISFSYILIAGFVFISSEQP